MYLVWRDRWMVGDGLRVRITVSMYIVRVKVIRRGTNCCSDQTDKLMRQTKIRNKR